MCGLFGIIGQGINRDDCNFFQDIMIFSAVRGTDATGFACGSTHGKGYVNKKASDPIWFLQNLSKLEERDIDNVSYNYFLGHTRLATKGEKTVAAAQPFEYNRIAGTHNGTLDINFDGFQSDSDAMFSRINSMGIKTTISMMKPNDAYAIVYYDKTDKSVNFIHNGKRKLYFALNEKRNTLYYASENGMLIAALWRNGIEAKPFFFSEDFLVSVKPQDLKHKGDLKYTSTKLIPDFIKDKKEVPFDGGVDKDKTEGPSVDV